MPELYERVEHRLEIVDEVRLHGLGAKGAVVRPGGTLFLHGTLVGDLHVDEGGRAYVGGRVTGHVDNAGETIIDGIVGGSVQTRGDGRTSLWKGSRIARGGWNVFHVHEDEHRFGTDQQQDPFAAASAGTGKSRTRRDSPPSS